METPARFESPQAVMQHALELAARGYGTVEPNPPVGAVLVDDDLRTLGVGWHQRYGGPHAEVHALHAAGEQARGATLFVTLEPCCHFGKTPPCAAAVIAAGVKRVVIGAVDPAPHVNGGGIIALQQAGLIVETGLLQDSAEALIAPFVQLTLRQQPWVHAKWAMTLDGKIAAHTGHSQWISGPASRAVVHQLRGRMDAIVTGIGTVLADDPLLTARPPGPRVATRVILDPHGRLPLTSQLVQTARVVPVLWVVSAEVAADVQARAPSAGIELWVATTTPEGRCDLSAVLAECGRRRWTHVLFECGGTLLGSLHDARRIDEVHAFIAPKLIGGQASPTPIGGKGLSAIPEQASLIDTHVEFLDGDIYVHGRVTPSR